MVQVRHHIFFDFRAGFELLFKLIRLLPSSAVLIVDRHWIWMFIASLNVDK